jgi:hypothetical protein
VSSASQMAAVDWYSDFRVSCSFVLHFNAYVAGNANLGTITDSKTHWSSMTVAALFRLICDYSYFGNPI